jgi:putative tryptophan/tyrosine transport system substrate-binding protein
MQQTNPASRVSDGRSGRPFRIAMFTYAADVPGYGTQLDMAERHLTRHGYREGENAEFRRFFGNRDKALTQKLAHDIVAWKADVVLSFMTNADLAMIAATREVPIPIVCWSMDPVGSGLVESAQRPGGNLTSVTWVPGLESAQLRVLRALNPAIERIGYLYNPGYAPAPAARRNMLVAGALFRAEVLDMECLDRARLKDDVASLAASGAEAIVIGPHEMLGHSGDLIADVAMANGIPSIGGDPFGTFAHAVTFNPDFERVWAEAASLAATILGGADPATIPVSRFIKPLVTLKLPIISRLNLTAPDWLLAEADCVIKNDGD